jgi:hypothetical protein
MTRAFKNGQLCSPGLSVSYQTPQGFKKLINTLYSKNWVVSVRKPIKHPEYVVEYLGRYTHRVAISNHRIVSIKDGMVTFTYKNRKTDQTEKTSIAAVEFIRRFLLHALPKRFVRIRHYGFLANRNRAVNLKKILKLFGQTSILNETAEKSIQQMIKTLTGIDITVCPSCKKGKMIVVDKVPKYTGICPNDIIRPPALRKSA